MTDTPSTKNHISMALQRVALAAIMLKTSKDQLAAAEVELAEANRQLSSGNKTRQTVIDLCDTEDDSSITSSESKSDIVKAKNNEVPHHSTKTKVTANFVHIIDLTK